MRIIRQFWIWIVASGVGVGLGCGLFFYFAFRPGLIRPDARMFDFWIPAVVCLFMLIFFRSGRDKSEPFHFWEGLIAGNLIFWLGGLFSGLTILALTHFDPTSFEHFRDSCIKYVEINAKEAPEFQKMEKPELLIKDFREMKPLIMLWGEVTLKFKYSIILVPLISVFIRRK